MDRNRRVALAGALAMSLLIIANMIAIFAGDDLSRPVLVMNIVLAVLAGLVAVALLMYALYGTRR